MSEAFIATAINNRTREPWLYLVTRGDHVDYPIRYANGNIAYDFPERVPAYVKRWVERAYAASERQTGWEEAYA